MICATSRARFAAEDLVLAAAFALLLASRPPGGLFVPLVVAIPLVLAFRLATLHFPRRVVLDDDGVSFCAYGRTHTFAWVDVAHLSVRRFLVKDRVLVRIGPASALRGRYWLTGTMDGFEDLVAELERRGRKA